MEKPLGISTCRLDNTLLIRLTGELDVFSASSLPATADVVFGQGLSSLVLDLTGLDYMDSTGLRQILRLHRVTRASHVTLNVRARENSVILRMLKLIGAGDVFPVEVEPESPSATSQDPPPPSNP